MKALGGRGMCCGVGGRAELGGEGLGQESEGAGELGMEFWEDSFLVAFFPVPIFRRRFAGEGASEPPIFLSASKSISLLNRRDELELDAAAASKSARSSSRVLGVENVMGVTFGAKLIVLS